MEFQEKMQYRGQINRVFTPGAPVDKYALFAGRMRQVQDIFNAVVQPGRHAIMFGERGVGKTSLARVLSEVLNQAGLKLVDSGTINCDGTDTFSSLWRKVFRELSVVMRTKQAGFQATRVIDKFSLENLLPEDHEIKPDDVRYVLSHHVPEASIIIIDEIDRIEDKRMTALLADTIKNLSDHVVNSTLILVGVADAVGDLIAEHRSIERALVQVPMPRMSVVELTQIIDKALSTIGMEIDDGAKVWIAKLSQGLPHYTHALGLYSALEAIDDGSLKITIKEVGRATRTTVEKAYTILRAYNQAVSSPQKQNLYKQVLLACALASSDDLGYFSAADVREPMSTIMDKPYGIPNYAKHLAEFCGDKRGRVLEQTGQDWQHRYRFTDPLMQPFVIIHGYSHDYLTEELREKVFKS